MHHLAKQVLKPDSVLGSALLHTQPTLKKHQTIRLPSALLYLSSYRYELTYF